MRLLLITLQVIIAVNAVENPIDEFLLDRLPGGGILPSLPDKPEMNAVSY